MFVRFRHDVIELRPQVVVILARTNDIAGSTGPIANEEIEANLASLADLARMHDYTAATGVVYLDYFGAMVDDRGMLRRDLAEDGLHPNATGYAIIARLADEAIQRALTQDTRVRRSR